LFPMTQAVMPNGKQTTHPRIPKARISPPRWGAKLPAGRETLTRSSPQYRQRVAAAEISSPHIGQVVVVLREVTGPAARCAIFASAGKASGPDADDSPNNGFESAGGTTTRLPQPGQFAWTPALSSPVLSSFWQCGQ